MLPSSNKTRLLISIGIAIVLVIIVSSSVYLVNKGYRIYDPYLIHEISGPVRIGGQWLEISFESPILPNRPANEISIEFEEEFADRVAGLGLLLPNRQVLSPEIQIVDTNGQIFELNQVAGLGPREFSKTLGDPSTWKETLPRDRKYRALRIRSDIDVSVSRIYWKSFDPADFK